MTQEKTHEEKVMDLLKKVRSISAPHEDIEYSHVLQAMQIYEMSKRNDILNSIDDTLSNIYNEFPRS